MGKGRLRTTPEKQKKEKENEQRGLRFIKNHHQRDYIHPPYENMITVSRQSITWSIGKRLQNIYDYKGQELFKRHIQNIF